ncbi:MAG: hypothetical protein ACRDN9_20620, partial [Streptosporangiaceae bacterium]
MSQQVGMVGWGQRPDVVQARLDQGGEVRLGVLPGVEDHGQLTGAGTEPAVAGGQLVDHGGELGDVRLVTWVGVR